MSQVSSKEKKSLFDSIVDNEKLQEKEMECQRLANRVGLIKKILINRDMFSLNLEFDQRLHELIKEFAIRIDDELYSTKENS